ncbi:hypothetical protein [Acinetobacter pollinis]|uniref:hypothetical protein n=1 Tax=Acinetobacter pollinis TaxID=2605270 RepID=UPI0018C20CEC|nr:hypothetical protein [Acinetobacter pollinis]MBF7693285.1 hypothetical protein [Acinetobacter pollinis]MBF7699444.1 hypothetical protein [Acinetobacter pollinis]
MGLLLKEKALIKNDYMQVWDLVKFLRKDGDNSWEDIAHFLGHHEFDSEIPLYKIDNYYRIQRVCGDYLPIRDLIEELGSVWLKGEESLNTAQNGVFRYYWSKFDLSVFEPLVKEGIHEQLNIVIDVVKNESEQSKWPLFYLNDTFSLIEASCLLSGDNPIKMSRDFNDTNFDLDYPLFSEAYNFINSAIWAGVLPENRIPSNQLKAYLKDKGKIILGFNDTSITSQTSSESFEYCNSIKFNFSKELDTKYIKVFTVVRFLKAISSLKYNEIGIHIRKIFNNLTLYTLDSSTLTPLTGGDFVDGHCIDYLRTYLETADEDISSLSSAIYSVEEYFWDKDEFFSNSDAITLGLSKKNYNLFLMASMLNLDDKNIFLNSSDMDILKNILSNRDQNVKSHMENTFNQLKNDLLANENELKQLKKDNENLNSQLAEIKKFEVKKNSNILDLICDDTAQERYAPDLVTAIKLWEYLYINNSQLTDSHSNRANSWIKNNTSYKNDTAIEAKRLREVTSPFAIWSNDRKKKLSN